MSTTWRSALPHRADHLWRYTDPVEFETKVDAFDEEHDRRSTMEHGPLPAGVIATSFDRAPRALIERVLGRAVDHDFGRFEALNAASFRHGSLIHVAKNAVVSEPIRLRVNVAAGSYHASRVAIVVEEGASVTLMEELVGGADEAAGTKATQQVTHVSEMVVGAQANVHHALIETLGRRCASLVTQRTRLERGAKIHPILAAFGGALTKADVGVALEN
ncbi:MAG: SufD family Fe-S cluster assembly protein [Candidatus Eisenbacteria bacterium]